MSGLVASTYTREDCSRPHIAPYLNMRQFYRLITVLSIFLSLVKTFLRRRVLMSLNIQGDDR